MTPLEFVTLICSCCGERVSAHRDHHGRQLTCAQLADLKAATAAAAACTTSDAARGALLLKEGRF